MAAHTERPLVQMVDGGVPAPLQKPVAPVPEMHPELIELMNQDGELGMVSPHEEVQAVSGLESEPPSPLLRLSLLAKRKPRELATGSQIGRP